MKRRPGRRQQKRPVEISTGRLVSCAVSDQLCLLARTSPVTARLGEAVIKEAVKVGAARGGVHVSRIGSKRRVRQVRSSESGIRLSGIRCPGTASGSTGVPRSSQIPDPGHRIPKKKKTPGHVPRGLFACERRITNDGTGSSRRPAPVGHRRASARGATRSAELQASRTSFTTSPGARKNLGCTPSIATTACWAVADQIAIPVPEVTLPKLALSGSGSPNRRAVCES